MVLPFMALPDPSGETIKSAAVHTRDGAVFRSCESNTPLPVNSLDGRSCHPLFTQSS
ncbi:MAG: hypothetical protein ACI9EF_003137 [Pseudohongiellaceae bacterium]|jgi:hypothetical protein